MFKKLSIAPALMVTAIGVMAPFAAQAHPERYHSQATRYSYDGTVCTRDDGKAGSLNLRSAPDLSANVRVQLPKKAEFTDLEQTMYSDGLYWRKISIVIGDYHAKGWAAQKYLCMR